MVTIADIARLSGVAKSTVSRYLNGGSVGAATRRKIERVIKETDYTPNTFAQSLKAKKTNMIGTIVPRLDSYTASQTMMGIDEELRGLECKMLIANTNQDVEREIENIHTFARQKAAGIILLATRITEDHLNAFRTYDIPVMLVGQQHPELHSLIHNDEQSAYDMGRLVLSKGHRRMAYLGVTEKDIAVGVKRKEGFARAIRENQECEVRYFETGFDIEKAQSLSSDIMDSYRPTVFVCATDNIALGVLKAAHMKKRSVPDSFSITGFGGYHLTGIVHPGLTTAKFFYREAGRLAARDIMKLINREPVEKLTVSGYEIIERESLDNVFAN